MRKIDGLKPVDEVFAQFEGIFKDFFWLKNWHWKIWIANKK
jgi:CRISPR/Cas system-associated endonuclease/helicase Cas3